MMDTVFPGYFKLFGFEPVFVISEPQLMRQYRNLQRKFHPDRYVGASELEQQLASKWSSYVNEAYLVLKDPLKRAQYLLEQFLPVEDKDSTSQSSSEFLSQQMNWRMTLEELLELNRSASELSQQQSLADQWQELELLVSAAWQQRIEQLECTLTLAAPIAELRQARVWLDELFYLQKFKTQLAEHAKQFAMTY